MVSSDSGGTPRKLVEGTDDGAVSPDGSYIAYLKETTGGKNGEIWLMGPKGESPHKILTAGAQSDFTNVKWSPLGNRIVYRYSSPQGQIVESCDLNGAAKTRILSDDRYMVANWISPGRFIYSRWSEPGSGLAANLWELKVDEQTGKPIGKPQRLTDWSGFGVWGLSATADGKHLAFLRGTYHQPVFVADLASNGNSVLNSRRLTADEYVNMPFTWTADSRELIFTSNRAGTRGIYRRALDGNTAQAIMASSALDVADVRVSPDGAWVVFAASPQIRHPERRTRCIELR